MIAYRKQKTKEKTELLWHLSNFFLTITRDHAWWLLIGNKKQKNVPNFWFKKWLLSLRIFGIGSLQESFWNSIWMRNLQEVVAYKKWSLWETVDCSRAAGCGGEGNDGGVDWYVDGDSGCGSYCFGGGEGIEIKLKWRYDCPSCNTNLSNNCNLFVTPPNPSPPPVNKKIQALMQFEPMPSLNSKTYFRLICNFLLLKLLLQLRQSYLLFDLFSPLVCCFLCLSSFLMGTTFFAPFISHVTQARELPWSL